MSEIASTVTTVGVAALTVATLVAGAYTILIILRQRRRRQIVVPALVNATGHAQLDGPVGEGLTAVFRERLDDQLRRVRVWLTVWLSGPSWEGQPGFDGRTLVDLEELLRGQPSAPAAEAVQTAQTLVASLTAAIPDASRPAAQFIGDMLVTPRGWRIRTFLRRDAESVAFSFVLEDLSGLRPSRPIPVALYRVRRHDAAKVPVPPPVRTWRARALDAWRAWIPAFVTMSPTRRGAAAADVENISVTSVENAPTPNFETMVISTLSVFARVVATELLRADLEDMVSRRRPVFSALTRRGRTRARMDANLAIGAVDNLAGLIYLRSVNMFGSAGDLSAAADDHFAERAISAFTAAMGRFTRTTIDSPRPAPDRWAAVLGNLARAQQMKATLAHRSDEDRARLLRESIRNYTQAVQASRVAGGASATEGRTGTRMTPLRLGLAVARAKTGDSAQVDEARKELNILLGEPGSLRAEDLYNLACGYCAVLRHADSPADREHALAALAASFVLDPDNPGRLLLAARDVDLEPIRDDVPVLLEAVAKVRPSVEPLNPAAAVTAVLTTEFIERTKEALTTSGLVDDPKKTVRAFEGDVRC